MKSIIGNQVSRAALSWFIPLTVAAVVWSSVALAMETKTVQVSVGEGFTLTAENVAALAVADPAVADFTKLSDKEISVIGKKVGVTSLTIVHTENRPTEQYRIEVSNSAALAAVRQATACPGLIVREVGDTLVLDGKVDNEVQAERAVKVAAAFKGNVVNLLQVTAPRQVRIRTRLVEVRRDAVKSLGIQYFGQNGEIRYGFGRSSISEGPGAGTDVGLHGFLDPLTTGAGTAAGSLTVEARLRLLAQKSQAKILAEPTLVTLSGKEASFLSGGEVPIVQQLAQSFTVEFKQFGILMKIKPTVDSDNHINTHFMAEASDVNPSVTVQGIPSFTTRRAETDVQLNDGQTMVIGGLLNNQISNDALRKVPWLGDIPVLGVLFRSKDFQASKSELLVFVTPELVRDPAAEATRAPRTPMMKDWLGGEAEKQLLTPVPPYPNWQRPLDRDEFDPMPPAPKPAAKPAAAAPGVDSNANFTPARPAGQ